MQDKVGMKLHNRELLQNCFLDYLPQLKTKQLVCKTKLQRRGEGDRMECGVRREERGEKERRRGRDVA